MYVFEITVYMTIKKQNKNNLNLHLVQEDDHR